MAYTTKENRKNLDLPGRDFILGKTLFYAKDLAKVLKEVNEDEGGGNTEYQVGFERFPDNTGEKPHVGFVWRKNGTLKENSKTALSGPPYYHEESQHYGPGEDIGNGIPATISTEKQNLFEERKIYHKKERARYLKRREEIKKILNRKAKDFEDPVYEKILKDLQAVILKHHKKSHVSYCLLKFKIGMVEKVKEWISEFEPTSAYFQLLARKGKISNNDLSKIFEKIANSINEKKGGNLNDVLKGIANELKVVKGFYLTAEGYDYLKIPKQFIPGFWNPAFKEGLPNRAIFKDLRKQRDGIYEEDDLHAMVLLAADSKEILDLEKKNLEDEFKKLKMIPFRGSVGHYYFEDANLSQSGNGTREPFGFKDGLSNPTFFPASIPKDQIDEERLDKLDLVLTRDICGNGPYSYGSFLTFLKLKQNKKVFEDSSKELAQKIFGKENPNSDEIDRASAYFIGRTKDGQPLVKLDDEGKPILAPNAPFDFCGDEEGRQCPIPAHIRQANPRTKEWDSKRIVRRGSPYGNSEDDQGLLFLSFQKDLIEQFEATIQNMSSYTQGDIDMGPDPIGSAEVHEYWQYFNHRKGKKDEKVWFSFKDKIVEYKGGWYFFAPSLTFLKKMKDMKDVEDKFNEIDPKKNTYEDDVFPFVKINEVFGLEIIDDLDK